MAKIIIDEILTFGGEFQHNSTTWQIATDEKFENIIDESKEDKHNLLEWTSRLPKRKPKKGEVLEPGDYYKDFSHLFARCMLHFGRDNRHSDWYKCKICNQNKQIYKVTRKGKLLYIIKPGERDIT